MTSTPMAQARNRTLQLVFGKAFLLALEDGNRESAMVFARAFLSQVPEERVTSLFVTA